MVTDIPGRYARPALVIATLAVGSCGIFEKSTPPPLPGERVSILTVETEISPDPRISDLDVMLPPPVTNASWPQQGGLAHHAMQHLAISELPTRIWQADIGTGSDDDSPILSGPVVGDGRVYAMDADAAVTAHRASDGRRLWRTHLEESEERDGSWGGGVALDGTRLYAATGFAQVIALDAVTGEIVWRTSVSGPVRAAPTVLNGRVFAISKDNQLHALDAEDGELLWTDTGLVESAGLLGGVSPAVDGDIVVAPYSSGEVVALKVENGRQLWSDNLAAIRRVDAVSALADIGGRPVIDSGRVYAISHSGRMVAIDLRTGRRLWEADLGGVQQPWVAGEFIFVLTSSAHVVSLTARDGRIRWVTPLGLFKDPEDRKGRINWSGPVLASDRLIVAGSHGEALSLSPYTGKILGRQNMRDGVSIAPALADETLFFLTDSAKLIAMR